MYINVNAIVLSVDGRGENDRRLSLFTREKGRLSALAVGVGRPGARLAAAAQPAVEVVFRLWMDPGRTFARITGGALSRSFPELRRRWARLGTALFLCEWTERLTPLLEPHAEKYDLLSRALADLEATDENVVQAAFLLQFLRRAGYSVAEALGDDAPADWAPMVDALLSYEFPGPGSAVAGDPRLAGLPEAAPLIEEKLLRFVSPLLLGPLKTHVHRRQLQSFAENVQTGA